MHRLLLPLLGVAIVALIAPLTWQHFATRQAAPQFTTPYQAVLLANGSVFFGKIENPTSEYPVLRDVHYIRSQVNPETKEVANTLIKRGQEWHQPDVMILNARHVMVIEPVAAGSQVAKLIEESSRK
jgi:hypothetical protein